MGVVLSAPPVAPSVLLQTPDLGRDVEERRPGSNFEEPGDEVRLRLHVATADVVNPLLPDQCRRLVAGQPPFGGFQATKPRPRRHEPFDLSSIGRHRATPNGAVCCATKFAVRAISDGLRQETDCIRVTVISPGVITSELVSTISDPVAREEMAAFRAVAISPEAVARVIA